MAKFYFFLTFLLSLNTATAQRFKPVYLINEKTEKPVAFYPVNLPKNQMTYSDLNGLLYYPQNSVLEFKYSLFQYLKINSNELGSSLYLRERTKGLEEIIIYKGEVFSINPFYKKAFKNRKNLIQNLSINPKQELLSKIIFHEKYYNRKVKSLSFRLINER